MDDLFCLSEYRGQTYEDSGVKARSPSATTLTLDTQFDEATSSALASAYLNATRNPAQSYTFTVVETLSLSDCVNAMNRIALTYGSISGYVAKITGFKVPHKTGNTTITVRGVA